MTMFPLTLGDPLRPKPPQFLHFSSPFVVSKHRDFVFGVQVDRS